VFQYILYQGADMERFQNILFASFGSKEDLAALDRANRLALANQASLTLIRVLEDLPFAASYIMPKKRLADFQNASMNQAQHELDELSAKLDASVQVKTKVLFGKPFIELIRTVLSGGHDLLIKPKIPTVKDRALDSTDLHLLRKCPCPVWIIKPNQRKPFGKILIAVDPDPSDPDRLSLHADLIKIGISLADREKGKVEVVHAWNLEGESMFRSPRFNMSEGEIQKMANDVESIHQKWIDDLLEPYKDKKLKVVLEKGDSGATLVKLIEKKKPDIVVMGTVARTGLPGLLIGNTAEYVLGQITCSILTLKPKGFKTPVS
jgi:nucleotide-binding universal stress UspA family protein